MKHIEEYLKKFFTKNNSEKSTFNEKILSEDTHRLISELSSLSQKDFYPDKDKIWNNIQKEIKVNKKSWKKIALISSAAAIALIFSLTAFIYFYLQKHEEMYDMLASNPGIEAVKIVLDNGESIFPQTFDNDTIISLAGGNIVVNNAENLKYQQQEIETTELVYNTIIVPKGKDYYFILSDGTEVWLNSDSKLRFPVNFQGEERKVFLEGEGYFNVTNYKNKPFRVELNKAVVEVLGTAFNIHSYTDREESTTTLVSGKIKLIRSSDEKEWILNPGKQLVLNGNHVKITESNTEEITSWREGYFAFNNKKLEDIFYQLEKWFKMEVVFEEASLKSYSVTGGVRRNESIEEILEIFEEITSLKYKKEKNKIIITSKKTKRKK